MTIKIHDPLVLAPYPVHTVEFGENFITLWLRGKDCETWARNHGIPNFHDREIFHKDDQDRGWLQKFLPGAPGDWSTHRHIVTDGKPSVADLERFTDGLSPTLQKALKNQEAKSEAKGEAKSEAKSEASHSSAGNGQSNKVQPIADAVVTNLAPTRIST